MNHATPFILKKLYLSDLTRLYNDIEDLDYRSQLENPIIVALLQCIDVRLNQIFGESITRFVTGRRSFLPFKLKKEPLHESPRGASEAS